MAARNPASEQQFGKKCLVLGSTIMVMVVLQTGLKLALVLASSVGVKFITNGSDTAADLVLDSPSQSLAWKDEDGEVRRKTYRKLDSRLLCPEVNYSVGKRNESVFSTGFADKEWVGDWKAAVGYVGQVILGLASLEAFPQVL